MLTRQRKQLILEKLSSEGQVLSKTLSLEFGVSEDTIRRDLRELAADGRFTAGTRRRIAGITGGVQLCERSSLGH
ncbi:DeoR-like helix-turn-helix domain [Leclercia adecarboxylata]|uniref:DeoR-like helix-turn-helix domain n=1 Tax=Leclercia adecarboxylata TaxID=83655 RepID=A0A4U9HUN7_9ENTR|nr:DeoR-like helix-turn-helix domain [Leclercia adecarboxylata]